MRHTTNTVSIDGTYNSRRVGASTAAWLVRSAALDEVTDAGREALGLLGIRLVVDLRAEEERAPVAHGIPVAHHPVFESAAPATGSIEAVYAGLLHDRGRALAGAVAAIADSEGPVLVHCAVGKDRTGLVVALALLAAGFSENEVVADYELSGASVGERRRDAVQRDLGGLDLDEEQYAAAVRLHLDSPADAMRGAIATVESLGGAAWYLRRNGLSDRQLDTLRERLGGASE